MTGSQHMYSRTPILRENLTFLGYHLSLLVALWQLSHVMFSQTLTKRLPHGHVIPPDNFGPAGSALKPHV